MGLGNVAPSFNSGPNTLQPTLALDDGAVLLKSFYLHILWGICVYFCAMHLLEYLPNVFGNYSFHPQGWIPRSHIWSH